ncbi:hypothetical protein [Streptacidiphilus sp. EB129]|uniref:hypothetical protein n=1 Tax=Streptacidiphilus sp. EB129 TaxID=3156262 RepID=UPI003513D4F9
MAKHYFAFVWLGVGRGAEVLVTVGLGLVAGIGARSWTAQPLPIHSPRTSPTTVQNQALWRAHQSGGGGSVITAMTFGFDAKRVQSVVGRRR